MCVSQMCSSKAKNLHPFEIASKMVQGATRLIAEISFSEVG